MGVVSFELPGFKEKPSGIDVTERVSIERENSTGSCARDVSRSRRKRYAREEEKGNSLKAQLTF